MSSYGPTGYKNASFASAHSAAGSSSIAAPARPYSPSSATLRPPSLLTLFPELMAPDGSFAPDPPSTLPPTEVDTRLAGLDESLRRLGWPASDSLTLAARSSHQPPFDEAEFIRTARRRVPV